MFSCRIFIDAIILENSGKYESIECSHLSIPRSDQKGISLHKIHTY